MTGLKMFVFCVIMNQCGHNNMKISRRHDNDSHKSKLHINTWIRLGKSEIRNPLFIQSQVPSDRNVVLSLLQSNIKKYNLP